MHLKNTTLRNWRLLVLIFSAYWDFSGSFLIFFSSLKSPLTTVSVCTFPCSLDPRSIQLLFDVVHRLCIPYFQLWFVVILFSYIFFNFGSSCTAFRTIFSTLWSCILGEQDIVNGSKTQKTAKVDASHVVNGTLNFSDTDITSGKAAFDGCPITMKLVRVGTSSQHLSSLMLGTKCFNLKVSSIQMITLKYVCTLCLLGCIPSTACYQWW